MKPYLAIAAARFRVLLQYRAAALAGAGTQVFWGFMRVMIFSAFYASSTAEQPMTLEQTIAYIWLVQVLLTVIPWRTDQDVTRGVRDGSVVYELIRPVDLYWMWCSRAVSLRICPALLRSTPVLIVACLSGGLSAPPSWQAAAAFACSLAMGILLSSAFTALINATLFWTISGEGVTRLLIVAFWTFTGILVPLPLFPDWMQPIMDVLPFRGFVDTPLRLYLGDYAPSALPGLLAHQLAWIVGLVLLTRGLLRFALRRVVIHGG